MAVPGKSLTIQIAITGLHKLTYRNTSQMSVRILTSCSAMQSSTRLFQIWIEEVNHTD